MRRRTYSVLSAGVVLVAGAVLALYMVTHHRKQPTLPAIPKDIVMHTTDAPAEQPLTKDTYHSTAAADEPSYISLPTIQAAGYVQKMGIDQHGQVAAPNNVNLAGWYIHSLKPGEAGLSIIDGHVDG